MPAQIPFPPSRSSRKPRGPFPEAFPPARSADRSAAWTTAACAAALLALAGCQDDPAAFDDDESPNHMIEAPKSQGKYRFGVTDTLAIDFSEPIDTAALDIDVSDSQPIGHAYRGRDRLLLFGTLESFGTRHFRINTSFTLTLTGLRDDAGNGTQSVVSETFQPYWWADRDVLDRNFRGYDSLFSGDTAWIDGSPLADSLVVEGALDFNENTGDEDRVDLKVVRLAPPDTLDVLVTTRKDLPMNLQVGGPFAPEDLDSAVTRAENFRPRPGLASDRDGRIDTAFHADLLTHRDVLGDADSAGLYVLRLSLPTADTEGFYRIRLKIRKYRRR